MNNLDLTAFAERGRITQKEAEDVHTCLMHRSGITDGDTIIADWNQRSPESLWGQDGESPYIHSFTDLLLGYMRDKLKETRRNKRKKS